MSVNRNMVRKRGKYDAQRIAAVGRQGRALEHRKHGLTYSQIAALAGYNSKQAAWKAARSALDRTRRPALDSDRRLELLRVDALYIQMHCRAVKGDPAAAGVAIELMAHRARLLGLDAPLRTCVNAGIATPITPPLSVTVHVNGGRLFPVKGVPQELVAASHKG